MHNNQAKEWIRLSSYTHVRTRLEMYFGSRDPHTQDTLEYNDSGAFIQQATWVPAIYTIFREILDNSLDELISHSQGNRLDITYDPTTMIFSISDNGRGIPIDYDETEQNYAATVLLSHVMTGRNFNDDRNETRGLNGIGAKGVNYCSEWLQVEVYRNGTHFEQRFHEGEELIIEPPIIFPGPSRKTGTIIRFKLSQQVFPHLILPESFVRARIHEIALCYPNLRITYNGKRIPPSNPATLFGDRKPIEFAIDAEGFKARFWLLPNFVDGPDFGFSLVNGIPLFNGGIHLDTFRKTFVNGLLNALERQAKKLDLTPNRADVSDGLLIYNIMDMVSPNFDSQAKTRLINENVGKMVRTFLDDAEFYKDVIKKNPEWIEAIFTHCRERTEGKDDEKARKKTKKNLRLKIEDLKDACGYDRSKCVLFLAEGNSAVSGLVEARQPEIHGGLPLRGKVLNVFGEPNKRIVENEALAKIMNSVGLVLGERANRRNLRYGQIYIATDADEDGKNIAALLINFFYQCWPELFDPTREPYIFIFETPLIIANKGKQTKYWYSDNYMAFDPEQYKGWDITRAKGLAALKQKDWKYVLTNPKTVAIQDDGKLKESLSLLFDHSRADDRKVFIGI